MSWPTTVPWFTPSMILQDGRFTNSDSDSKPTKCCAMGWLGEVFKTEGQRAKARGLLEDLTLAQRKDWGLEPWQPGPGGSFPQKIVHRPGEVAQITVWNDKLAMPRQVADALNQTMTKLGYEVDC